MFEFDPQLFLDHIQYVLGFAGLGLGWLVKRAPGVPTDAVPYVLGGAGLVAGFFLKGLQPLDGLIWTAGGGVLIHNLIRNARERAGR